jgi:predicted Zn-dependent protease
MTTVMLRMPRLTLIVAAIAWVVFLGAGCGKSSRPKQGASVSVTATATAEPSAGAALEASGVAFDQAASYRLRFTIGPSVQNVVLQGDATYSAHTAVYAHTTFVGVEVAPDAVAAYLFLPPDLYLQLGDRSWLVQSPWNQGIRPGEEKDIGLRQPVIDFTDLASKVRQVEQRPDETVDGRRFKRLSGVIKLADVPGLAAAGAAGSASIDVWIAADTGLLGKVQIQTTGPDAFLAAIEYTDYNQPFVPPPAPENARPLRDAQFPDAPCTGAEVEPCLQAQQEVTGQGACPGAGRRVCLVPLGKISPDLVNYLVAYYRDHYSLDVAILTPAAIPAGLEEPLRQQVDAANLIEYMGKLFPDAYRDPQAVLIGITPIDLYDSTSHFRYLFGLKRTSSDPKAVVSAARMNPQFYSQPFDGQLYYARTAKLLSKYIGLLYYGLSASSDAQSPMFNAILGPDDIDRMTQPLPVAGAR